MVKKVLKDTLTPKPIKNRITLYAIGTALEGVALGLFLAKRYSFFNNYWIMTILFVVGAIITISSYSHIKNKCVIKKK